MNEQSNVDLTGAKKAVIDALRSRARKARFTTELAVALGRANFEKDRIEQALTELESEGIVMIRDHFCADPHLAGTSIFVSLLLWKTGRERMPTSARSTRSTAPGISGWGNISRTTGALNAGIDACVFK